MTADPQSKTPKILPPHYFLLSILAILALSFLDHGELVRRWWPLLFAFTGIWLAVREKNRFVREGTTFYPGKDASKLITTGAYRFTRNPMYLGMLIVLLSVSAMTGSWLAALPAPVFAAIIQYRFILKEEARLEEIFGQDYRDFKSRVRRWI